MASNTDRLTSDLLIGGKYRLERKIGFGGFGDVYRAINAMNGEKVAVKVESIDANNPRLVYEWKVYKMLRGGPGIPRVKWFGRENRNNFLVMDLCGASIEDLFKVCAHRFSLKTVLMLADQMIQRLELVHNCNFVHRDVKPENFLMGFDKKHQKLVYLVDLGLAKKYRTNRSMRHISCRRDKRLIGTALYSSINSHLGIELSRRDDMESLGYVLVYLTRGCLPWQGIDANTIEEKYELIGEQKMSISVEVLCKGCPKEFEKYIRYCRALRFEQRPDYIYLRQLLAKVFHSLDHKYDYVFDWSPPPLSKDKSDRHPIHKLFQRRAIA